MKRSEEDKSVGLVKVTSENDGALVSRSLPPPLLLIDRPTPS